MLIDPLDAVLCVRVSEKRYAALPVSAYLNPRRPHGHRPQAPCRVRKGDEPIWSVSNLVIRNQTCSAAHAPRTESLGVRQQRVTPHLLFFAPRERRSGRLNGPESLTAWPSILGFVSGAVTRSLDGQTCHFNLLAQSEARRLAISLTAHSTDPNPGHRWIEGQVVKPSIFSDQGTVHCACCSALCCLLNVAKRRVVGTFGSRLGEEGPMRAPTWHPTLPKPALLTARLVYQL